MKILIADDHAVVRHGLRRLLAEEFKQAHFGEASNGSEALDQICKEHWDVVVLDLTMPGRGGLEVLREAKKIRPRLPVIMLSMHPEDQFAIRMLKAGASGYLTKDTAPQILVAAIRKVAAGGRYVSATLAERMASSLHQDHQGDPHEILSDREFLVLRLIAAGKPVGQIARELKLSVKTISTYRMRILEKMGLANNAELTRYALQNNLVENHISDLQSAEPTKTPPGCQTSTDEGPPRELTGESD